MATKGLLKVLCIAPAVDAPFIINIQQPLDILNKMGLISHTVRKEADVYASDIQTHDVILYFRNSSPFILKTLYYSRLLGKPAVFGVDDNFYELGRSEIGELDPVRLNAHSRYIQGADLVMVYSNPMVERAKRLNGNVVKVTPGIDLSIIEGLEPAKEDGKVRIVYATSRFKRDILSPIFFPAIKRILKEYEGRVQMDFWGYVPEEFRGVPGVNLMPSVDYETYLKGLCTGGFDIGLAPLMDDVFHRSKTNTKFRDYGSCRVAGIYSDVDVYSDCVKDGETGLLVENTEEAWYGALKRLIDDRGLLESIKANARSFVVEHYDMERVASDLHGLLLSAAGTKREEGSKTGIGRPRTPALFIGMRVPKVLLVTREKEGRLADITARINKLYAYKCRVRRVVGNASYYLKKTRIASYDIVVLDELGTDMQDRVTKTARSLGKGVIRAAELPEHSAAGVANAIDDLFYGKMIGEQGRLYTFSLKRVKRYIEPYRKRISRYMFEKTGLRQIERSLRRIIRDPLKEYFAKRRDADV